MSKSTPTAHPLMLFTTALFWAALNSHFASRYLVVVDAPQQLAGKIVAAGIVAWILLASFYACFHTTSFVFSLLVDRFAKPVTKNYQSMPPVAVLYTCKDDMQEAALESCLAQAYPNRAIFVLDDSLTEAEQARVDRFCRHHEQVTCLRREGRDGFKAGNLNHALRSIGEQYPYLAVVDADEILPKDFLVETVAIAEGDPSLGFVQARHRMYGQTAFGRGAGDGLELHWSYYLPARNLFGFVYFFGHGALLRTKACLTVGGFPEIVSEDAALAMRMRTAGYRGHFTSDVVCLEEVPPSYGAFRARHAKVVRGTLELIARELPGFLRSKHVSCTEKLDLSVATAGIYLPIPFMAFVTMLHFVMPLFLTETYSFTLRAASDAEFGYILTSAGLFRALWGWDTLAFTAFTVFAPLCYVLPDFLRTPGRVLGYVFRITPVSLSTVPQTVRECVQWLYGRQNTFDNTGRRDAPRLARAVAIDTCVGAALCLCAIVTGSLFLLSLGLSVLMIPLLMKSNGQGRLVAWLLPVPLALTLVAFISMPALLLGFSGALVGVALAHH